jgi:hypothetical protein
MPAVATFLRHTPKTALRSYFEQETFLLDPPVDWAAPEPEIIKPLLRAVDQMSDLERDRLITVVDRVAAMADEVGEGAIYSVTEPKQRPWLDAMANSHERALQTYLQFRERFRRAEEARFTDERRGGRMWDGFLGPVNQTVRRDQAAIDAFKADIQAHFSSPHVHIDIFNRHRPTFGGTDRSLLQATVYREGRPDDFLEFVAGTLDRRPRRPVFEAAMSYEPATGVIEVVAHDRDSRLDLVRLFARHLLAAEFKDERVPVRRFDLAVLAQPFAFPTDLIDGIDSVRVNILRLMPIDGFGERVTLEVMRDSKVTIWEMATQRFGDSNPLLGGWSITQARFTIRFKPEAGASRGKTLPLTITKPHGCDLKDRTERERKIGERYLRRWGFLQDL